MQQQKWITCKVFDGMFSDELVVELGNRSFFVESSSVRNRANDSGEIRVTIVEADGRKWAVMPTRTSETVLLDA